ncbi:MAG: serine/threonine-protein kinase, partial [Acidobacteriota bacterium]
MDHPIAQAPRKTPPPSIGPYQVRRRLAAGGMGEVVLAWDARLRRPVAIKRIRSDLPLTDERRRRFRREAQAAAHFAHPAIVGVHDIVEDAAGDAIVMEYVEGHSLAAAQRRDGIDVATAVDFARQIAEGLAAAHDRGLVHRDLKAENVMVTPEGHCKILDFGLAKPLRELDSLTREGTVLGTVRTMAPEQAKGTDVDARADLYALCVLLYELLTRRPIFRGANAQETALQVLTRRPPPLRAVRPELPLRLCRLVDGLLEKDRDARPPNAGLVAAELQALADSPEILGLGAAEDADDRLAASDAQTLPHAARALETGNGRQAFGFSAGLRRAARLRPALLAVVLLAVLGWAAQQTVIAATRSTEALPSSSAESSLPRTP